MESGSGEEWQARRSGGGVGWRCLRCGQGLACGSGNVKAVFEERHGGGCEGWWWVFGGSIVVCVSIARAGELWLSVRCLGLGADGAGSWVFRKGGVAAYSEGVPQWEGRGSRVRRVASVWVFGS